MRRSVYLDYNATAPVRPEVIEVVASALARTGNPSSIHEFGRAARRLVEDARAEIAALVGSKPARVVFTSGGTEANNLALRGAGRERVLVSAIEHDSVLRARANVAEIPVDRAGQIDLAALEQLLGEDGSDVLISVMMANNETGVLQPITEVVALAHAKGALVHCDAVQAAGKVAINCEDLGVDYLTISSHKLGGPQGAGALILGKGLEILPQQLGGGQERRRRGGTENVAGIAGFGLAARLALDGLAGMQEKAVWRATMETRIMAAAPQARIFGMDLPRVPNTTTVTMPGVPSDTQLMVLDLEGFAVSSGSACSSGKVQASHVLQAMGADGKTAGEAIRISTGWASTQEDLELFTEAWINLFKRKGTRSNVQSSAGQG
ncbi:cysteine desulfurase family protein [Kiloniella laminariae]|uniref:Cysteine desulfurase n=1 Tax=Kiloniella laminariae TaxID=454162 RepID=A0ABT4LEE6_9PROT|nr:cysteine desulfurase family protein [Kiloniella laminariae]MCZ4279457.1 cysteine desulfurase family protein [Kiloniella laminariae]